MRLFLGDCRKIMKRLHRQGVRVHAIVCDPPYHLGFMGKAWDKGDVAFQQETWELARKLLYPGGHLLAFGGTRTYHRLAVAIEDAGFEIRDMIGWLYGSGFPKSHNISKAIDKSAGAKRESVGPGRRHNSRSFGKDTGDPDYGTYAGGVPDETVPATEAAQQWEGWGTALKPAQEPIVFARKPLSQKTVAKNVLKHGTGAINIDASRVGVDGGTGKVVDTGNLHRPGQWGVKRVEEYDNTQRGRHPANIIHDGSDEVLAVFPMSDHARGNKTAKKQQRNLDTAVAFIEGLRTEPGTPGDKGSAARFFYQAKTSKKDRGEYNNHVTVKPTDLMRYLIQMVVPPGGIVLDPFMGSGSTGKAAWLVPGVDFIGIELQPENFTIAVRRISEASKRQLPKGPITFAHDPDVRVVYCEIER